MNGYDFFVSRLSNAKTRRSASGPRGVEATCPAHDDSHPSLHVDEGDDGMPLIICRSQRCPKDAILAGAATSWPEVYDANGSEPPERNADPRAHASDSTPSPAQQKPKKRRTRPRIVLPEGTPRTGVPRDHEPVAVYPCHLPTGEQVGFKVRYESSDEKTFRLYGGDFKRKLGDDGHKPGDLALYPHEEIVAAFGAAEGNGEPGSAEPVRVVVVEGEEAAKAGNNLAMAGTLFVSPMTGSGGHPCPEAWAALAPAGEIIFWPDCDEPGREAAHRWAADAHSVPFSDGRWSGGLFMIDVEEEAAPGGHLGAVVNVAKGFDVEDLIAAVGEEVARDLIQDLLVDADDYSLGLDFSEDGRQGALETDESDHAVGEMPASPTGVFVGINTFVPLPVDLLPATSRTFVLAAAKALDCAAELVAVPHLVALAGSIGPGVVFSPKRGYQLPPILWVAVVSPSGTKKSPALKAATAALEAYEEACWRQNAEAREQYGQAMLAYKLDVKEYMKSGVGEPPVEPQRPPMKRCIVDDTTVEGLAPILSDNPRGVTLVRDEVSGLFDGLDQYRSGHGTDEQFWLKVYDGSSHTVDRASKESLRILRAAICITGGIQPGVLRRVLKARYFDSGLAPRLQLVMPPPKPDGWTDAEIAPEIDHAVETLLGKLRALAPTQEPDAGPMLVKLDDDALAVWKSWENDCGQKIHKTDDERMKALLSKVRGLAGRLALILYATRCVEHGEPLGKIDARSTSDGIALARWLGHETARVWEQLGCGDDSRPPTIDKLTAFIGKRGAITVSQVQRSGPRPLRRDGKAQQALDRMVRTGTLERRRRASGPRGGCGTDEYVLLQEPATSQGGDAGDATNPEEPPNGVPYPYPPSPGRENQEAATQEDGLDCEAATPGYGDGTEESAAGGRVPSPNVSAFPSVAETAAVLRRGRS